MLVHIKGEIAGKRQADLLKFLIVSLGIVRNAMQLIA